MNNRWLLGATAVAFACSAGPETRQVPTRPSLGGTGQTDTAAGVSSVAGAAAAGTPAVAGGPAATGGGFAGSVSAGGAQAGTPPIGAGAGSGGTAGAAVAAGGVAGAATAGMAGALGGGGATAGGTSAGGAPGGAAGFSGMAAGMAGAAGMMMAGGGAGAGGMNPGGGAGGTAAGDPMEYYSSICASCHGDMGEGIPNTAPEIQHPVRDFATWVVRNGRTGLAEYSDPMEAYSEIIVPVDALNGIFDFLDSIPQPTTGEGLYTDYCGNCHGPGGAGGPAAHDINRESASGLTQHARQGAGLNDMSRRTNYMPQFTQDMVTDAEIQLIYQYLSQ